MNILLYLILFLLATLIGKLIVFGFDKKVKYRIEGDHFLIYYDKRFIDVELSNDIRIPLYTRRGKNEKIIVPNRKLTADQMESFMIRYKTSVLTESLFRFSLATNPIPLVQFDPERCRELVEIQLKLRCFIFK